MIGSILNRTESTDMQKTQTKAKKCDLQHKAARVRLSSLSSGGDSKRPRAEERDVIMRQQALNIAVRRPPNSMLVDDDDGAREDHVAKKNALA